MCQFYPIQIFGRFDKRGPKEMFYLEVGSRKFEEEIIFLEKKVFIIRWKSCLNECGAWQHTTIFLSFYKAPKKILLEITKILGGA